MRERPILFSGAMVRAILAGEKTQTRRAVKLQPRSHADIGHHGAGMPFIRNPDVLKRNLSCPYGSPGDRLWVRECFAAWWTTATGKRSHVMGYRADINDPDWDGFGAEDPWWLEAKWEPSIHMPRTFSRITLEVSGVRVQRLHAITTDLLAEGIRSPACEESGNPLIDVSTPNGPAAVLTREQFSDRDALLRAHWAALWCSINGRASWDANPWVWALTFERVEQAHG